MFSRNLHGLERYFWRAGRKRAENSAGVQPAGAMLSENVFPIDVARLELRDRGVSAVVAAQRCAHAKAALGKIQAIARGAADAVVLHPAHQGLVDSALINKILQQ